DVATTTPERSLVYSGVPEATIKAYRAVLERAQQQDFDRLHGAELHAPASPKDDALRRQRLWVAYNDALFPTTNAVHQRVLKSIDGAFKDTSNTEYRYATVKDGAYPPTLYKILYAVSMEAWGDARFFPLQNAYWSPLAVAAR